jgi:hypothetical protein
MICLGRGILEYRAPFFIDQGQKKKGTALKNRARNSSL